MRNPTILVGNAWLAVDIESIRFFLEVGNDKETIEVLTMRELKQRLPHAASLMGQVLALAMEDRP
jgi:hypothetical protein